jgi:hypothetical protein
LSDELLLLIFRCLPSPSPSRSCPSTEGLWLTGLVPLRRRWWCRGEWREVGWEGTARTVSAVCRRWHAVSVDESLWRSFFLSRWSPAAPPRSTSPAPPFILGPTYTLLCSRTQQRRIVRLVMAVGGGRRLCARPRVRRGGAIWPSYRTRSRASASVSSRPLSPTTTRFSWYAHHSTRVMSLRTRAHACVRVYVWMDRVHIRNACTGAAWLFGRWQVVSARAVLP